MPRQEGKAQEVRGQVGEDPEALLEEVPLS